MKLEELLSNDNDDVVSKSDPHEGQAGLLKIDTLVSLRRQEKSLIHELLTLNSEEAMEMMSTFWFSERGFVAQEKLKAVEKLISPLDAQGLESAANSLLLLIHEQHGWAEPLNRLAYVRFLQCRFNESIDLCQQVLRLKPWHFGARGGLAASLQSVGKFEEAKMEAAFVLPPSGKYIDDNGREMNLRQEWVDRMIREIYLLERFAMI